MDYNKVKLYIVDWIRNYCTKNNIKGLVVGVSGGIDSAVVSILCAMTGLPVELVIMDVETDTPPEATSHCKWLTDQYENVNSRRVELSLVYQTTIKALASSKGLSELVKANTKSRLRMLTLYAIAGSYGYIVVGTGNKVEDFGVGFFTKYGDGGVDISPIADLTKSEVYKLGQSLAILPEIQRARPTDGLWGDGRTDEEQLGLTYDEIEWAMDWQEGICLEKPFPRKSFEAGLEVFDKYRVLHNKNRHKIDPIPVCKLPGGIKGE